MARAWRNRRRSRLPQANPALVRHRDNGSDRRAVQSVSKQPVAAGGAEYAPDEQAPVLGVTWFEAALYCNWLSRREGRPPCYTRQLAGEAMNVNQDLLSEPRYRLPTEAEWEAAARAGSPAPRFYGASSSLLGQYAWYQQLSGDHAWPVGQLKPNDFGLFDVVRQRRRMDATASRCRHERTAAKRSLPRAAPSEPEGR